MDIHARHGGMDMDMSPTSTSPSMATSTSSMGGMGDPSMSMDSGMSMAMTFFTSARTPLYSTAWTPTTDGQYAGACIFLIVLACTLRLLLAFRPILETRFWGNNATVRDAMRKMEKQDSSEMEDEDGRQLLATQPGQALSLVGRDVSRGWAGWRVGTAAARATYELLIAGVGYLLMLAVMTYNLGYFLSVLGGIWFGTFLLGGLSYDERWSHC